MFCPKCGSILVPKKEGNKKKFVCSCGYKTEEVEGAKIEEEIKGGKDVEVVEKGMLNTLPKVQNECPKCKNSEAYAWTVQTRAADEPETRFYRCTKCNHTWREYD